MRVAYQDDSERSDGLKYFWNEHIPHIVYRNPDIQIYSNTHQSSPGINVIFDDGRDVHLPCGDKTTDSILDQFVLLAAANEVELERRAAAGAATEGPKGLKFKCICQIRGQCPCSERVLVPKALFKPIYQEPGLKTPWADVVDEESLPEGTNTLFRPKDWYLNDPVEKY